MTNKLSINAKRLMFIHNISGVLRILISTFLSIFLFKETGIESVVIFNIIQYLILPFTFYYFAKKVEKKNIINLYRIGIFIQFIFVLLLVILKDNISSYIGVVALIYGLGSGFYWYAYNLLVYNFNELKQRIKYLGYSKTLDKIVNIIVPVTLGALITVGSYNYVFVIVTFIMAFLFYYSLKLELDINYGLDFNINNYTNKVKESKPAKCLYKIAYLEGLTTSALTDAVFPIMIFLVFNNELSFGSLKSLFAVIAAIISYLIGKNIKGPMIRNLTVFSIISIFVSSLIYVLTLNMTTVIIYNVIYYLISPIRDYGYSHYAYNIIDLENLREYSKEHFVLREFILNAGRITGYLLVLFIFFFLKQDIFLYQILVLLLSIPSLLIIRHINVIEKSIQVGKKVSKK